MKFNSGLGSSYLNTMRSAINFFTLSSFDLENNVVVKRLFKFFFQSRPIKAKYSTFWPVSKLLAFLKSWHPMESLSLKQLTLKTIALLALTTSDRGQTLHKANIENMLFCEDNSVKFIIKEKLKTTRKILKPTIITCVSASEEEFNVANHIKFYIESTKSFRKDNNYLFLSWKTKKNVTRPTLARWLKLVLKLSGIDTSLYGAHSYRGAGLSNAFYKGAPIHKIMVQGNWSDVNIFWSHYHAPPSDSHLGHIILNDS